MMTMKSVMISKIDKTGDNGLKKLPKINGQKMLVNLVQNLLEIA